MRSALSWAHASLAGLNFRARKYALWYGKHAEVQLTKTEKRRLQGRKVGEVDVMALIG